MTDKRIFSVIGRKGYYSGNSPISIAKKYILKNGKKSLTQFSIKESNKNKIYSYEGKIIQQDGGKIAIVNRIKGGNPFGIPFSTKQVSQPVLQLTPTQNIQKDNFNNILQKIVNNVTFETYPEANNKGRKYEFFDDIFYKMAKIDPEVQGVTVFQLLEQMPPITKSEFVERMNFCPQPKPKENGPCDDPQKICFKDGNKCKQVRKGMSFETYSLFSRKLQQSYNPLTNYLGNLLAKQWNTEQVQQYLNNNSFFVIGIIDRDGYVEPYEITERGNISYVYYAFVKFSSVMGQTNIQIPYIIKINIIKIRNIAEDTPETSIHFRNIKEYLKKYEPYNKISELFKVIPTQLTYDDIMNLLVKQDIIDSLKALKKEYKDIGVFQAPAAQDLYPYYQKTSSSHWVFPNVSHQSYNIQDITNYNKNKNNITLISSENFARGNIFLRVEPQFTVINPKQILVNCLEISCPGRNNIPIKSFRYGTQIAPKGTKADDVYIQQTEAIKRLIGSKSAIIISLMDYLDPMIARFDKNKFGETKIAMTELQQYTENNIVFLNMAINNNVNFPSNSMGNNTDLRPLIEQNFNKLDRLIEQISSNKNGNTNNSKNTRKALKKLYDSFKDFFKYNVVENKIPDEISNDVKTTKHSVLGPNIDMSNENCRLIMFVFISLIFYLISVVEKENYILLYHCKSGQDRTGTFYAINQMVNCRTYQNFPSIIGMINANKPLNFINDIYNTFYSPNLDTYLLYARFLLFSYNVAYVSSGFPGLKWNLGGKKMLIGPVENKFPYLMLKNVNDAVAFEGASACRKS